VIVQCRELRNGPIAAMRGRQSADDDPTQFGRLLVSNLTTVEVKAFVPARDFALSKQFYQDLGFELAWSDDDLAYMRHGNSSFLLQNFYNEVHADNFMMHLLVTDVDAWWHHVQAQGIASKYDTKTEPPEDRPWGIRDFVLVDPTGVLWRIGQNISTVRR
jgi:uncharacterized glyoxalase superfamily protein PhnB